MVACTLPSLQGRLMGPATHQPKGVILAKGPPEADRRTKGITCAKLVFSLLCLVLFWYKLVFNKLGLLRYDLKPYKLSTSLSCLIF